METALDLFQSKNLTSSIKDLEDIPSLVVTSKVRKYHTMQHFLRDRMPGIPDGSPLCSMTSDGKTCKHIGNFCVCIGWNHG